MVQAADRAGVISGLFGVTAPPAYAYVGADASIDVVRSGLSADELAGRIVRLPRG